MRIGTVAIGQDGPPPDLQLRSIAVPDGLLRASRWPTAQAGADRAPGQRIGGGLAAGADGCCCPLRAWTRRRSKVAFTSEDRVRDVIRNFSADGFSSLYPKYRGGRAPKFTWSSAGRSIKSPSPSPLSIACRSLPGACMPGRCSSWIHLPLPGWEQDGNQVSNYASPGTCGKIRSIASAPWTMTGRICIR